MPTKFLLFTRGCFCPTLSGDFLAFCGCYAHEILAFHPRVLLSDAVGGFLGFLRVLYPRNLAFHPRGACFHTAVMRSDTIPIRKPVTTPAKISTGR